MKLGTGWNRGLSEAPEQPVIFFLRSGHWRWWSYLDLERASSVVAGALDGWDGSEVVSFVADRPRHELAVDLGIRRSGRRSSPRREAGESNASSAWSPPSLDQLEGRSTEPAGTLCPVGGVELEEHGPLEPAELAGSVSELDRRLSEVLDHTERPIVLGAEGLSSWAGRLWAEWAAARDAVLVRVLDEEDLPWAAAWTRPHLVLGSTGASRAVSEAVREAAGSGRWRRRFHRLRGWVSSDPDEAVTAAVADVWAPLEVSAVAVPGPSRDGLP